MEEEIDGADDREVVADAEHGGIVGRMEAGDQLIGCRLGAKSGEGLGQQIGTELGRAPPQSVSVVRRRLGISDRLATRR